jgi:NADPH:quinone reductase-like Zn-dependent oxidoreductase
MLEPRTHTERKNQRAARIPETMPAAAIDHFGDPEVLSVHILPVPKISATEVDRARYGRVGPWDADIRAGWYPGRKPKFPLVLGTHGAGVVAEVGSRVRRLKPGDKAYA